jgi:hypothetical protein
MFANPIDRWRAWFAWRPIWTVNAGWLWLRNVEYRACAMKGYCDAEAGKVFFQYKLP